MHLYKNSQQPSFAKASEGKASNLQPSFAEASEGKARNQLSNPNIYLSFN